MSLWEYKIITSGRGGFASPALLEKFLNDLGRDEWEIVAFHAQPENFLVFTGLARRPTQRDWTLEGAAAAAAKAEADKLRAEFEAKFKAATSSGLSAEERPASFLEEKVAPDDGLRKLVDTSHDDEPEEDAKDEDDWDKLTAAEEDELPTFFDAIKPHMRRNQRGPGMSVGVDYLAKKWDQSEEDLKGALAECGFTVPEDEDAKPEYLEFEGDLYWVNVNRRGELWINTKEKPRPVFRPVKAQKVAVEEEAKPEPQKSDDRRGRPSRHEQPEKPATEAVPAAATESGAAEQPERAPKPEEPAAPSQALPEGAALLDKIRPMMRRNRRGPGGSGSASFLSRALKCRESDLISAFKSLGLVVPATANEKPTNVEIGNGIWWVNVDSRGNVWINGRDKKAGEKLSDATEGGAAPESSPAVEASVASPSGEPQPVLASEAPAAPAAQESAPAAAEAVPVPEVATAATPASTAPATVSAAQSLAPGETLGSVRPLLKETRTGALANKLDRLAEKYGKSTDELVALLVTAGLVVPEKSREKPVFVEHAGEIFWLNRNAKGELWLNAKVSKFADKKGDEESEGAETHEGAADGEEKKPRRPRGKKKPE